ncbi:hypothetical protein OUW_22224 [Mycobacteroides abscessus M93]|nr:hypothetical protein OUW_22224 [Mycobacteroides abscessus M93]
MVGAGPAGIAAVGKLIDHGVLPASIAWIDPEFTAGDLGAKWRAVPSNTSVKLFINYLTGADSFRFAHAPHFALNDLAPTDTCLLGDVADPLVWITGQLCAQVSALRTRATGLALHGGRWEVQTELGEITSKNVILAVGSVPKKLAYPWLNEIPIEVALDPAKLAEQPLEGATVAVFGASHSSMIALPNLLAGPAAKVINFYRGPLRYAVDMGSGPCLTTPDSRVRPPAGPARTSTECFRTGCSVVSWTARNSPSYSRVAITRCIRSDSVLGPFPPRRSGVSWNVTRPTESSPLACSALELLSRSTELTRRASGNIG